MASPVQATAVTQRPCLCRNGGGLYKQFYETEAEAQAAADRINKQYEGEQEQHPYRCDEGGVWHLTSKPAGLQIGGGNGKEWQPTLAHNSKLVTAARVAELAGVTEETKQKRTYYSDETKMEAFKLYDQGLMPAEIARRLKVLNSEGQPQTTNVVNWLNNLELKNRYAKLKTPVTVEQFESEEARLERQLAEIRAKKQAAIDAKAFKFTSVVSFGIPAVTIKKERNSITLPLTDAEELVIRLDNFLDSLKTAGHEGRA